MDNSLIIILMSVFFMLMIFNQSLYRETFKNYLRPFKGLDEECKAQDKSYKAAFMPTVCSKDRKVNPYSNCKCTNKDGECKICYPEVKKEGEDRSVIYNPDEYSKKINKKALDYLSFNVDAESGSKEVLYS